MYETDDDIAEIFRTNTVALAEQAAVQEGESQLSDAFLLWPNMYK